MVETKAGFKGLDQQSVEEFVAKNDYIDANDIKLDGHKIVPFQGNDERDATYRGSFTQAVLGTVVTITDTSAKFVTDRVRKNFTIRIDNVNYPAAYVNTINSETQITLGGTAITGITAAVHQYELVLHQKSGTTKTIGRYEDKARSRLYYLNYNSDSFHRVLRYDYNKDLISIICESKTDDLDGLDFLNFQLTSRINSINTIFRTEKSGVGLIPSGDMVLWTDGFNEPVCFDTEWVGYYGLASQLKKEYILAAPLHPYKTLTSTYNDADPVRTVNNLRKAVFQFSYRWVYNDNRTSALAPFSKTPIIPNALNVGYEFDSTKYNEIRILYPTGDINVKSIQLVGRKTLGDSWSDIFLISDILKDDGFSTIPSNYNLTFYFYNDGVYNYLPLAETSQTFDWLPIKAGTQEVANGNVVIYSDIEENYDKVTPQATMTTANITSATLPYTSYSPSSIINENISLVAADNWRHVFFSIPNTDVLTTGDSITISFGWKKTLADPFEFPLWTYTTTVGNTWFHVLEGLKAAMESGAPFNYAAEFNTFSTPTLVNGNWIWDFFFEMINGEYMIWNCYSIGKLPASSVAQIGFNSSSNVYAPSSTYKFGLVYFDDKGRTNGVSTSESMGITTLAWDEYLSGSTYIPKNPKINLSLTHLPPSWATNYCVVRSKNRSLRANLVWVTSSISSSNEATPRFKYLNIDGLLSTTGGFHNKFSDEVINYDYAAGDRVRIIKDTAAPSVLLTGHEYEIMGFTTKDEAGTVGNFIKITNNPSASALPSGASARVLVHIYRPSLSVPSSSSENETFYEFGENYTIVTGVGGIRYHKGKIQDQTAALAATFEFTEGDIYLRAREGYPVTPAAASIPANFATWFAFDYNFSDFFKSAQNSNGRIFVYDALAKKTKAPALIRFSQTILNDSAINGLNRFYYENQDEYDITYGAVKRLKQRDRNLRIFQERKCGLVPMFQQIIKDTSGNPLSAESDRLLNKIQYYVGDFGMGKLGGSLASHSFVDYFFDEEKGAICRLSNDGLTPISLLYNLDNKIRLSANLSTTADSNTSAVYSPYDDLYILRLPDKEKYLSFFEQNNAFQSYLSLNEYEGLSFMTKNLFGFRSGKIYKFKENSEDNGCSKYNGVQNTPNITFVFNEAPVIKKTFLSTTIESSDAWICPTQGAISSLGNQTSMPAYTIEKREGAYHGYLLKDETTVNVTDPLHNGAPMRGNWLKLKLAPNTYTGNFVTLSIIQMKSILSNLNTTK